MIKPHNERIFEIGQKVRVIKDYVHPEYGEHGVVAEMVRINSEDGGFISNIIEFPNGSEYAYANWELEPENGNI